MAATAEVYAHNWPRPKPAASLYDLILDGSGTGDVELNNAINTVAAAGGGRVVVYGRTFSIGSPIFMQTGVTLEWEAGLAARIVPTSSFPSGRGVIELLNDMTHGTVLRGGYIDGNGRPCTGVLYKNDGGQVFTAHPATDPDPAHVIDTMFIKSCGNSTVAGHGMIMRGGNLRAGKYMNVRIQSCTGTGLWLDDGAADSHYHHFDIGGCGNGGPSSGYSLTTTAPVGHGMFVSQGDNNMFTACKAWYNRGAGFYNRGTRNSWANCQAQDNHSYGFQVPIGKSTFVGCIADSNGQAEGSLSRGRAGFHLSSESTSVVGCQSYDRGGQAWKQQHGFQFTGGLVYSRVTSNITWGNEVASTTGTPGTGTVVDVQADAGGK